MEQLVYAHEPIPFDSLLKSVNYSARITFGHIREDAQYWKQNLCCRKNPDMKQSGYTHSEIPFDVTQISQLYIPHNI